MMENEVVPAEIEIFVPPVASGSNAEVEIIAVVNPMVEELVEHVEVVISSNDNENDANQEVIEVMDTDADADPEPSVQSEESVQAKPSTSGCGSSSRPVYLDNSDDGDVGTLCSICYSPYTNSGKHRLSCLKCGHLFGEECVRHWLKDACTAQNRRCPTCNTKASLRDIRILYTKNLVAVDTTEKDQLMKKLDQVQKDKNNVQAELNSARLQVGFLSQRIRDYEKRIKELEENSVLRPQSQKKTNFLAKLLTTINIGPDGGGRVLAHAPNLSLLVASQCSANPLFTGYGIRKINTLDMKAAHFFNIHKKAIRDMVFAENERGTLLTVSLDCTAKLFDVQNNAVVQNFQVPVPLWSCSWSSTNPHKIYCGGQNGTFFVLDRRQPGAAPEQVVQTDDPLDKSGIISICHIPPRAGRFMPNGGLLACRLNNIIAYYLSGDKFERKQLPIEGSFMSMKYNVATDHLLVSAKASSKWPTSRHMVCQLSKNEMFTEQNYDPLNIHHTFYGSGLTNALSRSAFVQMPNDDLSVSFYNFRNNSMDLWNMASSKKLGINEINMSETVLDTCSFMTSNKEVIMPCLSDRKVSVIKLSFD